MIFILLHVSRMRFEPEIYPFGCVIDLYYTVLLLYAPDTNLKKINTVIGEPMLTTRKPIFFYQSSISLFCTDSTRTVLVNDIVGNSYRPVDRVGFFPNSDF